MNRSPIIFIIIVLVGFLAVGVFVSVRGQSSSSALDAGHPASDQTGQARGNTVSIDNFSFTPGTLTVPIGSTVTWTNKDDVPHTVVENNQKFKSKALDTDETFSQTFTEPGTYEYFCSVHPKMT